MKLFKTISVFVLAVLVLFSSSNFRLAIHLCADKVYDIALFSETEKCEMEKKLPPCHKHLSAPCCDDETIVHEAEGFKASFSEITISPSPVLDFDLPEVIISEVIPSVPSSQTSYYQYDPPLRSYDLTVSHHVFLI
jgi:hypothetical protein